jgi:Holliday junction resolvasome RuvABC endonuclease subunit
VRLLGLKKAERVLSIDCSTSKIAFALFEGKELQFYGEIDFPGKNTMERLPIGNKIMHDLAEKFQADRVAVEASVYIQNKRTVILLAYATGAFVSPLANGAKMEEISVLDWQAGIGNGNLTAAEKAKIKKDFPGKSATWYKEANRQFRKDRTISLVNNKYGINVTSPDVADAIGVGWYVVEKK